MKVAREANAVTLGLSANWHQFALLVAVTAFVGAPFLIAAVRRGRVGL